MGAVRVERAVRVRRIPLLVLLALAVALGLPGAASGAAADAVRGGDGLFNESGTRCTVGLNATDGSDYYGLLPGHCGAVGTRWFADAARTVPVGETVTSNYPGGDYAVVRYTNPDLTYPSEVTMGEGAVRIDQAIDPRVGMEVCRSGSTSGWHCGTVTAVDISVSYPDGVVNGLFSADICAEPGDDGGPAVSGNAVVGILSGGAGDCASGGEVFYQPAAEPLAEAGLSVGY